MSDKKEYRLFLVDDHQLFLDGLRLVIKTDAGPTDFVVVGEARDGVEALEKLNQVSLDIIILDLNMPVMDGLKLISAIKRHEDYQKIKILVLTGYGDDKFTRIALKNGADGILLKTGSSSDFFNALHYIIRGELYIGKGLRISPPRREEGIISKEKNIYNIKDILTKRELEVLVKVSKGNSNKIIASDLFISPETVSVHRKNIIKKLKLKNTAELIKFALEYNII